MSGPVVRQPVFVDVDTGIDDAVALVYLLASPDSEVVGVAATAGNVPVDRVCANTLDLLAVCGRADIPVWQGAGTPLHGVLRTAEDTHGPTGLGYARLPPGGALTPGDGARAWIDAARRRPGELVGLVTGPLTTFALALRMEPGLPRLLRRLVIMGGAFGHPGNTTPVGEWNVLVDPEAAAEVFTGWTGAWGGQAPAHLPVVLGLNLTERIALTPDILAGWGAAVGSPAPPMTPADPRGQRSVAPNAVIRMLEDALRFYFEFHADVGEGYLAHLHDPLAAAVALDPGLVGCRDAAVGVELDGTLTRGMTVADWRGHWGREPNARIGLTVDPTVVFDRLQSRIGRFARERG